MELDMFEEYNPEDYVSTVENQAQMDHFEPSYDRFSVGPRTRRSLTRSPSIDLFPSFDTEPILRPRVNRPPVKAVGGRKTRKMAPKVKKDQKEYEMRVNMKKRLTGKVYTEESYGKLNCLWSVSTSVFQVPQKVKRTPTSFLLFKSAQEKQKDPMDLRGISKKWRRMKKEEKKIWQDKAEELKNEQKVQIEMGAVVVCNEESDEEDD